VGAVDSKPNCRGFGDLDRSPIDRYVCALPVDLLRPVDGSRALRFAKVVRTLSGEYSFLYRRLVMKTLSYTESRARYAEVLDSVVNDREEVVITRAGHDPVVIVSLADFESLRETAYLMRSPTNARRLLDAMERLEGGQGQAHDLLDGE
jgi:antitoxin YefM